MVNEIQVVALDIDGVLTDGTARVRPGAEADKRIAFVDLDAVTQLRRAGFKLALVTGEDDTLVDQIAQRFGIADVCRGAKDKAAAVQGLAERLGVPVKQICYVGDSDRDAAALALVGFGCAPSNATPAAKAAAHCVFSAAGGAGAVAELTRLLLRLGEEAAAAPAMVTEMQRIVQDSITAHQRALAESLPVFVQVAQAFVRALRTGRKILLFGNGGSAADAQHVAGELVGRFLRESEPWPAIALTTDSSILTCVGNDWDFSDVFARQVRAHARPGDVVVGISTSGNSPNVLRGLEDARRRGAVTIGFTGPKGDKMRAVADICFCAPAAITPRVQELHLIAWHAICEIVERQMLEATV
jgi:D-sedoheptulose 7-phosphate isomerase